MLNNRVASILLYPISNAHNSFTIVCYSTDGCTEGQYTDGLRIANPLTCRRSRSAPSDALPSSHLRNPSVGRSKVAGVAATRHVIFPAEGTRVPTQADYGDLQAVLPDTWSKATRTNSTGVVCMVCYICVCAFLAQYRTSSSSRDGRIPPSATALPSGDR